jgi:hypothetical protein
LDRACGVIILKSARLFFDVQDAEPYGPGASRLLENWHRVPVDGRESALLEFQRLLWQGFLEDLEESNIKKGAVWHD